MQRKRMNVDIAHVLDIFLEKNEKKRLKIKLGISM